MAARKPYEDTSVPVSRSQERIRTLLMKYGAKGMQFAEDFDQGEAIFRFAYELTDPKTEKKVTIPVKLQVSFRDAYQSLKQRRTGTAHDKLFEQARRQVYRFLEYWLKSNLEAIDFGLLEFTDVFLSAFELQTERGRETVGQLVKPRLTMAIEAGREIIPKALTE